MQKTSTMPFGCTARAHSSMVQCMKLNGPKTLSVAPSSPAPSWGSTGKDCGSPATALAAPGACPASQAGHDASPGEPLLNSRGLGHGWRYAASHDSHSA
jgi:hypothetical protein